MIFNPPFFGSPYHNRYSRYMYNSMRKNYPYSYSFKPSNHAEKKEEFNVKNINNSTQNSSADKNLDSPFFNIFGINLYFDDILLISLIFFLYKEGVEDESLFVALILLLLS